MPIQDFKATNLKLIIGLGNPSPESAGTYHNLGVYFIDELAKYLAPDEKFKREKYFEYLKAGGLILIKPLVFMNESGLAAGSAVKFFSNKKIGVTPEQILIIHDDSDLLIGDCKLDFGRGAAGHKGVLSIIGALKTRDFWRLRIGIRRPDEKERSLAGEMVLRKIPASQKAIFQSVAGALNEKLKVKTNP
ncbi:MAG: aminoacyl-tRNA hydrolase [Patescibacteria group bacterium]|nr:aminoacyl-tRNA hydrolase [Patescibacteria group bacterium]